MHRQSISTTEPEEDSGSIAKLIIEVVMFIIIIATIFACGSLALFVQP